MSRSSRMLEDLLVMTRRYIDCCLVWRVEGRGGCLLRSERERRVATTTTTTRDGSGCFDRKCFNAFFSFSLSLSASQIITDSNLRALLPHSRSHLERLVQVPDRVGLHVGVLPAPARRGDAGDELGERREQALDAHARHLHELAGDES